MKFSKRKDVLLRERLSRIEMEQQKLKVMRVKLANNIDHQIGFLEISQKRNNQIIGLLENINKKDKNKFVRKVSAQKYDAKLNRVLSFVKNFARVPKLISQKSSSVLKVLKGNSHREAKLHAHSLYISKRLQKNASKAALVNRCLYTNQSRVMYKGFKIGRMRMKEMLRLGIFPGYRKASW